jgi:formylmethanofuran dehydrogenase subunit D
MILFVACSSTVGAGSVSQEQGNGTIQVSFLQATAKAKGLIDINFAKTNSSYFELIAYNTLNRYSITNLNVTSGGSVTVAAGTYNVVILAGALNSVTAGSTYQRGADLYGTAYVNNVVVVANTTTPVAMTLTNSTFTISAPTSVYIGNPYTITVSGNTGSPQVMPDSANLIEASTQNNIPGSGTPTWGESWSVGYSLTAPSTAGSDTYYFCGGGINLYDSDINSSPTPITGTIWELPDEQVTASSTEKSYCTIPITFTNPPPTQISVTVGWGSGQ